MTDNSEDKTTTGGTMAELLDAQGGETRMRVHVGDKIKGAIIAIGKDTVFVDTGTKNDGVVDIEELLDENRMLPYVVGDEIELYVMSIKRGEVTLSRALSGAGGAAMLEDAYEGGIPVEGKVKGEVKGGFEVEILKRRAFCPVSQIDLKYVSTPADYVGQTVQFLITQFEENGRNIVVSRRQLLEQEQLKARETFMGTLSLEALVDGTVVRILPFGAFIHIGPGVEGMLPISEMGWSRTENPEDVLEVGQVVRVKIIALGGEKITLSLKQAGADPWSSVTQRYRVGETLTGKVTRLMKFGAFVELEPGIEGLVHISAMSFRKRVIKPEEMVSPGQIVQVLVKEVDPEKKRISLSMKEAEGDPWADIEERYPVGRAFEGTLEKKEKFGWFINLEGGITGLLPKSRIDRAAEPAALDKLKPGDKLVIKMEEIQKAERRLTLGLAEGGEADWQGFGASASASLNPLAAKLQSALDKKKKR